MSSISGGQSVDPSITYRASYCRTTINFSREFAPPSEPRRYTIFVQNSGTTISEYPFTSNKRPRILIPGLDPLFLSLKIDFGSETSVHPIPLVGDPSSLRSFTLTVSENVLNISPSRRTIALNSCFRTVFPLPQTGSQMPTIEEKERYVTKLVPYNRDGKRVYIPTALTYSHKEERASVPEDQKNYTSFENTSSSSLKGKNFILSFKVRNCNWKETDHTVCSLISRKTEIVSEKNSRASNPLIPDFDVVTDDTLIWSSDTKSLLYKESLPETSLCEEQFIKIQGPYFERELNLSDILEQQRTKDCTRKLEDISFILLKLKRSVTSLGNKQVSTRFEVYIEFNSQLMSGSVVPHSSEGEPDTKRNLFTTTYSYRGREQRFIRSVVQNSTFESNYPANSGYGSHPLFSPAESSSSSSSSQGLSLSISSSPRGEIHGYSPTVPQTEGSGSSKAPFDSFAKRRVDVVSGGAFSPESKKSYEDPS